MACIELLAPYFALSALPGLSGRWTWAAGPSYYISHPWRLSAIKARLPSYENSRETLEVELEAKLEQATVKSGRISLRKIRQRRQQFTGSVRGDDAVDLKDAV